jgi:hypothetical protein
LRISHKGKEKKNTPVHQVETLEFKTKLFNTAERKNDKLGEGVSLCIRHISDLAAAEGRYHNKCYNVLQTFSYTHIHRLTRGPAHNSCHTAHLQHEGNEDQCQFTLDEIFKDYNGYVPVFKTIRDKLPDRCGEDITITSGRNRKPITCF